MAHIEQQQFCLKMKSKFPNYFVNKKVLDIGSLDVNGNNRFLFENCEYFGLDVGEGKNVDIVCPGHLYDAPSEYFDIIISTEVFEHDLYYRETISNIMRMLKPGGIFMFTCASGQRPEHGTRRRGEVDAPLLIQQSEEWADYYKNLEKSHFLEIHGFSEAFPDGIFELGAFGAFNHEWPEGEYTNIHSDIYFFGIKGGIAQDLRYSPEARPSIIGENEFPEDIFVLDAWPNSPEKEADLLECIKKLREFSGIPILLATHYPIRPEIQQLVDYFIYDKDNPILLRSEFSQNSVNSGRWSSTPDFRIDSELPFHHDYAIWKTMQNAFNFCKYLGKKVIHFIEYDNLIDTFQFKQAFMEPMKYHDFVIYEYSKGSLKDFDPYCATYIFSIKTDIAVQAVSQVNSRSEYFIDRPKGWQLERVLLSYVQKITSNIHLTKYIPNNYELNTQAVWNRDGIFRGDAIFQVYLGADSYGDLYCHLISGFYDIPADRDYLVEIKYDGNSQFKNIPLGEMLFINLGKYKKGLTVEVRYYGKTIFKEFLGEDLRDFREMSRVTRRDEPNQLNCSCNFINGVRLNIGDGPDKRYTVNFIDNSTDEVKYSTHLSRNSWASPNIKYFIDWRIEVFDEFNTKLETLRFEPNGKRIYVSLDSKSLGDTLAWLPYVDEFGKKWNCEMVCSTFWNNFFTETYPHIEFIMPGEVAHNIYAMYNIGWFYGENGVNFDLNPLDFKLSPLQKTSSDILGLDYREVKPIILFPKKERLKKVGLGINSTAQAKYWNNPTGWQEVTDWLLANGFEPIILSREEDGYMGNQYPVGATKFPESPIEQVIDQLAECQAFIGISSGLTWLAWATDTPTIQISGFTEPFNEPNEGIIKISAPIRACSGCANRLRLDAGDWNWCPDLKGTERQFECSKLITAEEVIGALENILL